MVCVRKCFFFLILHLHVHDSKVVEFIFEYVLYKIFSAFWYYCRQPLDSSMGH